jgi:ABC-type transporter Mla MlaB component
MQVRIAKTEYFEVQSVVSGSADSGSDVATLSFVGNLNEEVNLEEVIAYLGRLPREVARITLDLSRIRTLNSAGVRQWLHFIDALPRGVPIFFCKVSEVLVDQANLVPDLLGSSRKSILSLFAPYVCEACNTRSQIEIDAAVDLQGVRKRKCPHCGKSAELDGLVEEYFGFLKQLMD